MKNKNHTKKMIAPIVITVIMILYYVLYFGAIMKIIGGTFSFLLGILPLLFGGISVYVCIQRIKEIRSGEEDDLSQY